MAIVLDGTSGITTPALDTDTKISPADLGTGTPDATNFLRGDGSWQTISTSPTTDQVLSATAGASVGAVGTYAWCQVNSGSFNQNTTTSGSNLRGYNDTTITNPSFSGTWRNMGAITATTGVTRAQTLWLRIS